MAAIYKAEQPACAIEPKRAMTGAQIKHRCGTLGRVCVETDRAHDADVDALDFVGDLIGLAISLLTFYFHRIVLVTDQNVYVYRDWPFHIPGKQVAAYPRHADLHRQRIG